MAEPSKDELRTTAEAVGIDPAGKTKPELRDAIETRTPPALGPTVGPDGADVSFDKVGGITGVQPLTADDIPDEGR